ncbi:tRNA pseudouridine(55) synthase TruB [Methylovirgula sp. 4M-Z18]|uniref:tRNA pseudouridine(55) synthase TruB n=1 Tax=Methylovirgula sp. 4M-Z18 TaxID=2293567 RepID=UPI000E2F69ED|nr:tRNA pseudouridine(55) synthase TruB [Methylovirgula sp. 4M-Z18]RFB77930.1 tRNA pseudouridine(55) synthase TruB [Methylovirgula sp. 4M-Z18]
MSAPRSTRVEVNGWVILDKPYGMTSTHAVSQLKRIYNGKKAGHAGTLDPLASGILPIAFGEATKTVPFVQDGQKAYRFTVRWGAETTTDDTEGSVTQTSDIRPSVAQIEVALPHFIGEILQRPPAFSAIKVGGERAYDLARDGEEVVLEARPITIHDLRLVDSTADEAVLEAECGKGTYVRALARDLGRMFGCYGHVTALRRTRVGPFTELDAVPLDELKASAESAVHALLPVETGLSELACVIVDRNGAARLRRGQSLILRGRDAPAEGETVYAACGGVPVAFGVVDHGQLVPSRVFNLPE